MPFTEDRNWYEITESGRAPGLPALFLDRDGVVIEDRHYLKDPGHVRLIEATPAVVRAFMEAGYRIIVVSNQSGIGRGLLDWPDLFAVQDRLRELWKAERIRWDMALFCPHHPDKGEGLYAKDNDWRKPHPGMMTFAARALKIDLRRSLMVGDKLADCQAAAAAGLPRAIHVLTGHGVDERDKVRAWKPPLRLDLLDSLAALEVT